MEGQILFLDIQVPDPTELQVQELIGQPSLSFISLPNFHKQLNPKSFCSSYFTLQCPNFIIYKVDKVDRFTNLFLLPALVSNQ